MSIKPIPQDLTPSTVPPELTNLRQWVGWEYNADESKKIPLDLATGGEADVTDPDTWGTFSDAVALFERVGYVFTRDDPYCGIDFDDCGDRATGYVHPAVLEMLDGLGRPYTEWSPSGEGLKSWVKAVKPGVRCSTKATPWRGKIEVYDRDRFFTVTGDVFIDGPVGNAQEAVNGLYERFLGEDRGAVVTPFRRPSSGFSLSDDEVLDRARNCRMTGARFSELYDSGSSVVPVGERSEADYFFLGRLAYWTGGDREQMKRLFRLSDLARGKYREKGHHGEDYLERTVGAAIRGCRTFYDPSEGERMREKVREVVRGHRERFEGSDLTGSGLAVMHAMLDIAGEVGSMTKRGVRFNANQQAIADELGISQKTVSRIIQGLRDEKRIRRLEKGSRKKGRNSTYRLPIVAGVEGKND